MLIVVGWIIFKWVKIWIRYIYKIGIKFIVMNFFFIKYGLVEILWELVGYFYKFRFLRLIFRVYDLLVGVNGCKNLFNLYCRWFICMFKFEIFYLGIWG